MSTFYATFQDAADAERAAGALIDHGVARDDLTITSKGVSAINPRNRKHEAAVQSAENEGWPVRPDSVVVSEQQIADERDNEASNRYHEADKAERSAKCGISITTFDDVVIGALRGGFLGACAAVAWVAVYLTNGHALGASSMTACIVAGAIGLVAGTTIGAAVGLLTDQGASGHPGGPRKTTGVERSVLLVVEISSGHFADGEAQRLISKYHASSIEVSR